MAPKYSLQQMREVWSAAYFEADIEQLRYVEADFFFVKRGSKVLTKQQQLLAFERQKVAGQRQAGSQMRDVDVTIAEQQGWATVQGLGQILNRDCVTNTFMFCELWVVDGDRWRVAALCFDETNTD